jgi:hypothetical protein
MRTKEDAADYRYFPDPDLPPLVIARDWVEKTRSEMSELPRVMAARFVKDYGLPEYDAGQLTQSKAVAAYFEAVAAASQQPKLASNWVMGELSRRLNAEERDMTDESVEGNRAQAAALGKPAAAPLGLADDWLASVIASVGNYGQIFDRNLGEGSPLGIRRGVNALWTEGGILYAPPMQ